MSGQGWAEERAEVVHKRMNDYEPGHPEPCSDCRIIAAALVEAEARSGVKLAVLDGSACAEERSLGNGPCGVCVVCLHEQIERARAEGERAGREAAAQYVTEYAKELLGDRQQHEHQGAYMIPWRIVNGIRALRGKP